MNPLNKNNSSSGKDLRLAIRSGQFSAPTTGFAPSYVQANVVILPSEFADEFAQFCQLNPKPCPLIEQTKVGCFVPNQSAPGADLRTDVPRYRVYRDGILQSNEPLEITSLWNDNLVAFLLGCSFTFENALQSAGLGIRHLQEQCNVPMYQTNISCKTAGRFAGPMVVSMRPFPIEVIEKVKQITAQYPAMHGEPIHIGDPTEIGIQDLQKPDFGDAVNLAERELPLFWACGVTPQLAILNAKPPLAITHSPGCMFVTDLRDEDFCEPIKAR